MRAILLAALCGSLAAQSRVNPGELVLTPAMTPGTLVKFVPPLVAHGRVYVPNYDDAVNVYGLVK